MRVSQLVVLLCGLAVLGTATSASAAPRPQPERLTLRLADAGPGYVLSSDSECGLGIGSPVEGEPSPLALLAFRHPHTGCLADMYELWAPPGSPERPLNIGSAVFAFRDEDGPTAAIRHPRELAEYVFGLSGGFASIPLLAPLGDAAVAYRVDDAFVLSQLHRPAVVVIWRSGTTLALVMTGGLRGAAVERETERLAAVQQQRIEHPTPLTRAETDDVEVPLDDPQLDPPAMWLGRDFDPAGKLPGLTLTNAGGSPPILGDLRLDYGPREPFRTVSLYVSHRSAWRRHARTRFGRLGWAEPCVRATRVRVEGGVAVIYAGHVRRQRRCGSPPDRFLAHVFLRDVTVSVNPVECLSPFCREWGGPYDSAAGMRAIVRALRPR